MKQIIPVVAACILREEASEVLLHKKDEPRNIELLGKWEFPGGMVEYGEGPEEALRREIKEELGVAVEIIRPIYAQTNIYDDGRHYLVIFYECRMKNTTFSPDGCRWVSFEDAEGLACLPGTLAVIHRLSNSAR